MDRIAARIAKLYLASHMTKQEAALLLGIPVEADPDTLRSAYRKKSREYHPDLNPSPEATSMMSRINEARAVLESGDDQVGRRWQPDPVVYEDPFWTKFRDQYGPKPSGHYGASDLEMFAQYVLANQLLQAQIRTPRDSVPVTAGIPRGSFWVYMAPFGSKAKTTRITPGISPEQFVQTLKTSSKGGEIFDLVMKPKEAWVTWKHPGSRPTYQSFSFEPVRGPVKKDPNVGLTIAQIDQQFRQEGLAIVAGGSKLSYWGPAGWPKKTGIFVRQSAKTLRVVRRESTGDYRGIQDYPINQEVYFGALTPDLLTKYSNYVKQKNL